MNDNEIDPLIGRQIATFNIQRQLGRGGMATVYYGQDINLKRPVAIKVIDARFQGRASYAERFVQEAQAVARWRHDNIIQVYYADNIEGLYFFAMEYIDGKNLAEILEEYTLDGELTPIGDVLRIGEGIGRALDYAHQNGVIHRDVKPSNVFIERGGRVVLGDFGLALDIQQGSLGETFGTAHYIAPEQARHSNEAVPQSDLYALGVILYEMLTGVVPFDDPSPTSVALQHITQPPPPPRSINPHLSEAVEIVLLKALSKAPEDRYPTGAALMQELRMALFSRASASLSRPDLPPLPMDIQLPSSQGGRPLSRVSVFERASLGARPPTPAAAPRAGGSAALPRQTPLPAPPASRPSGPLTTTPLNTAGAKPTIPLLAIASLGGCALVLLLAVIVGMLVAPRIFPASATTAPGVGALPATALPVGAASPNAKAATQGAPATSQVPVADIPTATPQASAPQSPAVSPTVKYPDGKRFMLYYDENSFYMLEVSGGTTYVTYIAFERLDAKDVPSNRFSGQNWSRYYPTIKPGVCMRMEIIGSSPYLAPPQCNKQYVVTRTPTRDNDWIFWTKKEGTHWFRALWKDDEVGRCEIGAGECEVFFPQ